ncbi:MAG: ShlB/FhaC/HecB family hemolysin secretion/activation protein [Rhodobacteraceae bacterium]|nr:ShlB/FhaC/HecB family hemolysin secretion/activation protein [Paracoccaceae bacterium]
MTVHNILSSSVSALVFTGLIAGFGPSAFAQTASQITQPSYAPPVIRQAGGGLDLPATGDLKAPAGAEKLHVTPSGLVVKGQLPGLEAETAKVEASLKGKRVTGADLFAAARALEAVYAQAGYLLARVTLPPQTIKDGLPLKLTVTDGYVESIDASALPGTAKSRVEAMLQPLVGKHALTKGELERRLLLAGDTPGVLLKSTLKPGTVTGSTVIVVDGRYDPVTVRASVDNSLGEDLGRYSASLGANFNNLLGFGEVGYLQVSGYPGFNNSIFGNDPRNRQIVAGFNLPLGIDGLWLNMEGVDSRTHPTSSLGFTTLSHYQRFSTKLGYNWVRSRNMNTSSVIAFDIADETQQMDTGSARTDWTQDRLRVLRLTQNADIYTSWGGFLSGGVTASFGLDAFGARHGTTALPMSRSGAEPNFSKLEINGRYSQGFADNHLQWSFAGKAQTSFGNSLASSEQMGLGGFDWLSAFEGSALQGDGGIAIRSELAFPVVLPAMDSFPTLGTAVAPYVFGAAGLSKLEKPSAVEETVTRAVSFGAGMRFGLSQKGSSDSSTLSLEYAHGAQTNGASKNRFNLRWTAGF